MVRLPHSALGLCSAGECLTREWHLKEPHQVPDHSNGRSRSINGYSPQWLGGALSSRPTQLENCTIVVHSPPCRLDLHIRERVDLQQDLPTPGCLMRPLLRYYTSREQVSVFA